MDSYIYEYDRGHRTEWHNGQRTSCHVYYDNLWVWDVQNDERVDLSLETRTFRL